MTTTAKGPRPAARHKPVWRQPAGQVIALVEGQCEEQYLRHLQQLLNVQSQSRGWPGITVATKILPANGFADLESLLRDKLAFHDEHHQLQAVFLIDVESTEDEQRLSFESKLRGIARLLQRTKGKISATVGYSNFCFELWLLMHKQGSRLHVNHRHDYLKALNAAFGTECESLSAFKKSTKIQKNAGTTCCPGRGKTGDVKGRLSARGGSKRRVQGNADPRLLLPK